MRTLVIIPTYNEIENIGTVLEEVLSLSPDIDILVIDDNSQDGTGKYVDEFSKKKRRVSIIHRERKLGLGTAYKLGFQYAIDKKYDYIFEMDADLSHNPKDIPRFLEKIKNCDLVIGSRYKNGVSVVNWPMSRLLLSYFANIYARIITGVPVRDLTAGFKCYKREVLEAMDLKKIESDGYGFQIETVFWAYKKGFTVEEIPIIFVDRTEGTSKMSKQIIWEALWIVWKLRIRGLFTKKIKK
ncbi:MAG TPA: polyprenol monophosphomannose synthase [bacterium (Candidatus Stahlbacteria)]|nr:polyprenol monophosphomannose synthase [Candidatus Stahlbacteria bacterium]